eukprot:3593563-Lingulodinium_polyedra.AAC.1
MRAARCVALFCVAWHGMAWRGVALRCMRVASAIAVAIANANSLERIALDFIACFPYMHA